MMSISLAAALFSCLTVTTIAVSPILQNYAFGNRDFSAAVYKVISEQTKGSFLACPISVSTVMSLAGVGARGETQRQLFAGLRVQGNPFQIYNELIPHLQGNEFYALATANKIYVREGFEVNNTYKQITSDIFNAEIDNINFAKAAEASKTINAWTEQKTNGKITELVSPDDLSSTTKMILVNAIHFKGKWLKPFDAFETEKKPFHTLDGASQPVEMMHLTDYFNYYESPELKCKFLEMSYEGGDVSMVFVLPNERTGLNELQARAAEVFRIQPFTKQHVKVAIPRFSMETSIQFKPILEKLGVKLIFTPEAQLDGISKDQLYIDKVVQKTFINVTEKGTEAAAATAGGVVTLSIPAPDRLTKLQFVADHPFFLYIHFINKSISGHPQVILFNGQYTGPKSFPRKNRFSNN